MLPAALPSVPPPPSRAYPAGTSTDDLRARLVALSRGTAALIEEDADLAPATVDACKHHLREALRILFLVGVEQMPREDYAGPMPIPFDRSHGDARP